MLLSDLPTELLILILSEIPREAWKLRGVSTSFRTAALTMLQLNSKTTEDCLPARRAHADVPADYPLVFALNTTWSEPTNWNGIKCIRCRVYLEVDKHGKAVLKQPPATIREVEVSGEASLQDVSVLKQCTQLRNLLMSWNLVLEDVSPLANCKNLQILFLHDSPLLRNVSSLSSCRKLQLLDLYQNPLLENISALEHLKELQDLNLSWNPLLKDISPLAGCKQLRRLSLHDCGSLQDITPLSSCTQLRVIRLYKNPLLRDISALASCTELNVLQVDARLGEQTHRLQLQIGIARTVTFD
jgi:Leucine-rich repeat (LRR) protein